MHASSGTHHATTLGTTDSETYEVTRGVAVTISTRQFMTEIGYLQTKPSRVRCDNAATVTTAKNAGSSKKGLYMKRRVRFNAESTTFGEIEPVHIAGTANSTDVLTKPLSGELFAKCRAVLLNVAKYPAYLHKLIMSKAQALA